MPAVAVPGQPSPLGRPPQSTSTTLPPFHHPPTSSAQPGSSASPTQSHRSMSSLSSSNGASFHSSLQQPSLQAQQQPPPGSPRGAVAPPLRSVDSSRTVQLADGTMGLSREQSLRGQVGVMSLPPPSAVSRGGAGGPVWNPPLASPGLATRNVDEFWGNPKRLSSNGSSNGWDVDPSASELAGQGGGGGGGGGGPGSVEDELEMALRRSPLVKSLVGRISTTESAILNLTSQLSQLSSTVSSLLPASLVHHRDLSSSGTPSSSAYPGPASGVLTPKASATADFSAVSLLTAQVVALSSSVNQLQAIAAQQRNRQGTPGPGPNGTPWEVVPRDDYTAAQTPVYTPGGRPYPPAGGPGPFATGPPTGLPPASLGPAFNLVLPPSKPALSLSNLSLSSAAVQAASPSVSTPGGTTPLAVPSSTSNVTPTNNTAPTPPSPRIKPPLVSSASTSAGGPGLTLASQARPSGPAGVGGPALQRPGVNRSYSSPYGAGGAADKAGGPPRRPGGLGRMDSYDPSTPTAEVGTPGGSHAGWPQPPPGQVTPGGSSGLGPGAAHNMVKWDQVGLVPDLLRGVLKYGIGPPNKVQQRALPFLLRGSDIIAQAPPTQERIIAYVVPAINICLSNPPVMPYRGPQIVIITTTVDQATQAYKLVRDIATPLGVRSSLCVGATTPSSASGAWIDEQRQVAPSVVIGTPAKINELFSGGKSGRGLSGDGVRFLVIDEVDQLIARNLYEFVIEVVKRFPLPRTRSGGLMSPSVGPPQSPFDAGASSPFNPTSNTQFPSMSRRFPVQSANPAGAIGPIGSSNTPATPGGTATDSSVDRQTCLFSNTVPQDVLNFSNAIQVREPVRVLVRREGGGAQSSTAGSSSSANGGEPQTPGAGPGGSTGGGLKHLYLYLAFTSGGGGGRAGGDGAGTIGSGRAAGAGSEANQAKEWKLEALADLLDDEAVLPGMVVVGTESVMEAVAYKLATRGLEVTVLHPELTSQARAAAVTKFRTPSPIGRGKALVVFDLHVKVQEIGAIKLVINYDLPRSVEGYAQRVSPAVSGSGGRPGVVVNMIQANGGDVEMLRSFECFFRFKCSEVPVNLREAF